jgi:hypothetical protein
VLLKNSLDEHDTHGDVLQKLAAGLPVQRPATRRRPDTETADCVSPHLKLAGRSDTLFSDDAVALIHQVSRGLPRAVNNLAIQALVAAFATSKAIVDESSARAAITEATTE